MPLVHSIFVFVKFRDGALVEHQATKHLQKGYEVALHHLVLLAVARPSLDMDMGMGMDMGMSIGMDMDMGMGLGVGMGMIWVWVP